MSKDIKMLNDSELENVTGGTEPDEWSIPENGLPKPSRNTEPLNTISGWIPDANEEWTAETPESLKPGTYELHGVAWGQD